MMLNVRCSAKKNVIKAFIPLMSRDRLPLDSELKSEDRIYFEDVFYKEFGISKYRKNIHHALMQLFTIRLSVI